MIAKLSPDLTARILDQIVLERVRMVEASTDLPDLEDDLAGVIDECRRPSDPPARAIAVHLILAALRVHDDELAAREVAS